MRKAQRTHTQLKESPLCDVTEGANSCTGWAQHTSFSREAANRGLKFNFLELCPVFRMIVQSDSMDFRMTEDVKHLKRRIDFGKIVQNVNK